MTTNINNNARMHALGLFLKQYTNNFWFCERAYHVLNDVDSKKAALGIDMGVEATRDIATVHMHAPGGVGA